MQSFQQSWANLWLVFSQSESVFWAYSYARFWLKLVHECLCQEGFVNVNWNSHQPVEFVVTDLAKRNSGIFLSPFRTDLSSKTLEDKSTEYKPKAIINCPSNPVAQKFSVSHRLSWNFFACI